MHRILIIGVGSIGERHLRCFLGTKRVEAAFVEPRAELRETISSRYQVPGWDSLETALSHPFSAAVIATPAPFHVPQAMQCLVSGWHVLIEKPLSTSLESVAALEAAAQEKHLVAGVAYVYRCHPLFERLRERLHSGQFGPPRQAVAVSGQHFPTYRPAYRTIYYTDRATGGGAIQDALTHVLNAGEWLLGPIDRLVADADHLVLPGVSVEDTAHVLARHGDVMASYSLNQHQAPNEMTFTVTCERGTIRAELHNSRISWMTKPGDVWEHEDLGAMERDTIFVTQANRFLEAVEGTAPVPCSLADGAQTLRVNLAALASVETRSWQSIR